MTTEEYDELLFAVRRSVRYHMHRCRHYDRFHDITTGLTIILGLSAVGSLISDQGKWYAASFSAFVSILGVLDLVIGTTRKARLHQALANRFIDLEKKMASSPEAELQSFINERLDIEKDEPPVLRVLDVLCHNEVMKAMGHKKGFVPVSPWQRLFANWFDVDPHSLNAGH